MEEHKEDSADCFASRESQILGVLPAFGQIYRERVTLRNLRGILTLSGRCAQITFMQVLYGFRVNYMYANQ
jgi:hypothetical protein